MAEQKNSPHEQTNAQSAVASGVAGTILPSDLAIPCWVAPLQSPTPFRQAKYSLARKMNLGAKVPRAFESQNRHKRLPGQASQNRRRRLPDRGKKNDGIPTRKTGTLGIIVIVTRPQSTHCRFSSATRLSIFSAARHLWQDLQTSIPSRICSRVYRFLNHLLLCRVRGIKWWKLWASSDSQSSQSMAVIRTSFSPMSGSENIPHRTLTIAR